jgi:hypothetical protein
MTHDSRKRRSETTPTLTEKKVNGPNEDALPPKNAGQGVGQIGGIASVYTGFTAR